MGPIGTTLDGTISILNVPKPIAPNQREVVEQFVLIYDRCIEIILSLISGGQSRNEIEAYGVPTTQEVVCGGQVRPGILAKCAITLGEKLQDTHVVLQPARGRMIPVQLK